MNIRGVLAGALALAVSAGLDPAHAVFPGESFGGQFILNFDENGNGSYRIFDSATGSYGAPVTDTGFIDVNGFLAYRLPFNIVEGDIPINDESLTNAPCTSAATCSDGLRFTFVGVIPVMEFMSRSGGGDLADTGFASNFFFDSFTSLGIPTHFITETGDAFIYDVNSLPFALPNSPIYTGSSRDPAVPEPASLALFATALAGFGILRGRRNSV